MSFFSFFFFFFFNDTATTEIYTLSLHDALPISAQLAGHVHRLVLGVGDAAPEQRDGKLGQQGLGLILVDIHGVLSLGTACKACASYQFLIATDQSQRHFMSAKRAW